jgi:hypothetical protein
VMPDSFPSCLRCGDKCDGGGPCLACVEDAGLPSPQAVVDSWNAACPIGTRVLYWPLRPTSSALPLETRTKTIAYLASPRSDHASIMVEGVVGSVNLSTHVDPLPPGRTRSELEARVVRLETALHTIATMPCEPLRFPMKPDDDRRPFLLQPRVAECAWKALAEK